MRTGRLGLAWVLTIPFVALSVGLALSVATLSYMTGERAVDTLAAQLLRDIVQRTGQAIERHVEGTAAVLEVAFPAGLPAPDDAMADLPVLRTRFWIATSIRREPGEYVFYGNREGQYVGLLRRTAGEAELLLKASPGAPRQGQRFSGIAGTLEAPVSEATSFDPRERPWYRAALGAAGEIWTPIYVDYGSDALVATRARRVLDREGSPAGVVATDVALEGLNRFLKTLRISPGGFAYIVDPEGGLVATSRGDHLRHQDGRVERLFLDGTGDPALEASYRAVRLRLQETSLQAPGAMRLEGLGGQDWEAGFARVRDPAGLDWGVVVAVPRQDFLAGISSIVARTAVGAALAALLVVAFGVGVVRWLSGDVSRLAEAARRIGDGDLHTPVGAQSTKELRALALSFEKMQYKLRTDVLTGLANRDALQQRLAKRLQLRRRGDGELTLAVLFVDLDAFKSVNDRFGHDAGDAVLLQMGLRLRQAVRDSDLVARWAGDEFLVLLDGVRGSRDAETVRHKVEAKLGEPLEVSPGVLEALGGSVGLAVHPGDGDSVEALIAAADADMYRRKKSRGRGRPTVDPGKPA